MTDKREKVRIKHELIVETWRDLGSNAVGARELELIQCAIAEKIGEGAVESPASIARILADSGAQLRHPEVLDSDTRWREKRLFELFAPEELNFGTLPAAEESLAKLEELRKQFELERDSTGLERLREVALRFKENLQQMSQGRLVDEKNRLVANEVVQWLAIWLRNPQIFPEWLSLRKKTREFVEHLK